MLEQSSHTSSRSNLFTLSQQSSRSHHHNKHYSSFIRKVKNLLQAQTDDLDDLYRKVEIIVNKYFKDHQIVEFADMYNHIAALKSNGKKMTKIVEVLQKKLVQEQERNGVKEKSAKNSDRSDMFQVTSSTQKQSKHHNNKKNQIHHQHQPSKQPQIESPAMVKNSIKYGYTVNPSFAQRSANHLVNRQNQREKDISSSKQKSPNKLNASFQEYQHRNRQYQDKVRLLMAQLKDIKHSLVTLPPESEKSQHRSERSEHQSQRSENRSQRSEHSQQNAFLKQQLQIRLDDSVQLQIQQSIPPAKESATKNSLQQTKPPSRMSDTGQSETLSLNRQSISIHINHQPIVNPQQNINKQKQNVSSVQTIGEDNNSKTVPLPTVEQKDRKRQSDQKKKSILMSQAYSITRQLQQIKDVASLLQIQSNQKISEEESFLSSQTKIMELYSGNIKRSSLRQTNNKPQHNQPTRPQTQQNDISKTQVLREENVRQQFERQAARSQSNLSYLEENVVEQPKEEKRSKQLLERISNASSKVQPTEEMIPSFKNLSIEGPGPNAPVGRPAQGSNRVVRGPSYEGNKPKSGLGSSERLVDSSLFSFSKDSQLHQQQPSIRIMHQQQQMPQFPPFFNNTSASSNSSGFGHYNSNSPNHHLASSVVQQGFYPKSIIQQHHPQVRLRQEYTQNSFQILNQNRSTPSLAHPSHNMTISVNRDSRDKRYSHLRQQERSSSRTNVRFVNTGAGQEYTSDVSMNSSGSTFKKRGLKVTSPPSL